MGDGVKEDFHFFGHVFDPENPGKDGSASHDDQKLCRKEKGGPKDRAVVSQSQGTVEERGHDEGVENRHSGRLGGGEDAEKDAEQNDGRHHEGHKCILGAEHEFLRRDGDMDFRILSSLGQEGNDQHLGKAHENARHDGRRKQGPDGNGCHGPVDDDDHGRRNNGADNGRGRRDRCGKGAVVALLLHGRNEDGAQCGDITQGYTRDPRKQHGGEHIDVGQPAAPASHDEIREIHDPVRDFSLGHDLAGKNEIGNAHEDKRVHAGKELLGGHIQERDLG